ncbi:phosphoglycerate mutase [Fusarium phyllophilum]|uniref:Phosphoglycerate mutase n=1 Tax=Fusarium phyllophilum TaxID=47803 RepID=A0A8H5KBF1_9HYPO|nr:phosphoglycerate mutase [Fusarium phyllophilum]
MSDPTCSYKFTFEPGWFVDYPVISQSYPGSKLTTQPNLGLLDGREWARLTEHVERLNEQDNSDATHKVLLVARHGHGVHNDVMEEVESEEWKNHWSKLPGDANRTWLDAELVEKGVKQAKDLGKLYTEGIRHKGFPVPDTFYTSPLARGLKTTSIVFRDIVTEHGTEFRPIVKEYLRERLTNHTCDKRRTRQWIQASYPDYELESRFAEEDMLWHADRSESNEAHVSRTQELLEDVWRHDSGSCIALTTHSFTISTILEVIGAPEFRMGEGAMVTFLVKGEKINAE